MDTFEGTGIVYSPLSRWDIVLVANTLTPTPNANAPTSPDLETREVKSCSTHIPENKFDMLSA